MKSKFHIEITDTFGGEANYCWKKEFVTSAKSQLGAIQKLARAQGGGWHKESDYGDMVRYNLQGACVCCFVSWVDEGIDSFADVAVI